MRAERKAEPGTEGFDSVLLLNGFGQVSYIIRDDFWKVNIISCSVKDENG